MEDMQVGLVPGVRVHVDRIDSRHLVARPTGVQILPGAPLRQLHPPAHGQVGGKGHPLHLELAVRAVGFRAEHEIGVLRGVVEVDRPGGVLVVHRHERREVRERLIARQLGEVERDAFQRQGLSLRLARGGEPFRRAGDGLDAQLVQRTVEIGRGTRAAKAEYMRVCRSLQRERDFLLLDHLSVAIALERRAVVRPGIVVPAVAEDLDRGVAARVRATGNAATEEEFEIAGLVAVQDGELPARHHADEQILTDGGPRRGLAQVRGIEPEGDREFVPKVGNLAVLHRRAVVLARLGAKRVRRAHGAVLGRIISSAHERGVVGGRVLAVREVHHEPRVAAPEVVAQGREAGGVRAPEERQHRVFRERRHLHPHD